jgi:hypothetical protein
MRTRYRVSCPRHWPVAGSCAILHTPSCLAGYTFAETFSCPAKDAFGEALSTLNRSYYNLRSFRRPRDRCGLSSFVRHHCGVTRPEQDSKTRCRCFDIFGGDYVVGVVWVLINNQAECLEAMLRDVLSLIPGVTKPIRRILDAYYYTPQFHNRPGNQ